MEFEQGQPTRVVREKITAYVAVHGAEPRSLHGSKALWRPESIRVLWTRNAYERGEWSDWHMDADLSGSWLRKDGSRANRDPHSTTIYRSTYSGNEWTQPFVVEAEKTRPTHEPPALPPLD